MSVAEPLIQASLLGEAIDHGPVAVFVADERGRYVAVNQPAMELLGYSREELLALKVSDVARGAAAKAAFAKLRKTRAQAGRATFSRKDGSTVEVEYRAGVTRMAQMEVWITLAWPTGA